MAKMSTLVVVANVAVIASGLIAIHHPDMAVVVGGLGCVALMAGGLIAAWSLPRRRLRSTRELTANGFALVIFSGVLLVLAVVFVAVVDVLVAGVVFAAAALATAVIAAGMLRAARILRFVPELIARDEEPRAVALDANGMPGAAPKLVVCTDDRIVWARGGKLTARHALRLVDVDRFDADGSSGTLTVAGGRERVRVRPVARHELEKFERLLLARRQT